MLEERPLGLWTSVTKGEVTAHSYQTSMLEDFLQNWVVISWDFLICIGSYIIGGTYGNQKMADILKEYEVFTCTYFAFVLTRIGKYMGNQLNISGEWVGGWMLIMMFPYKIDSKYPANPWRTQSCVVAKVRTAYRSFVYSLSGFGIENKYLVLFSINI